MQPTFAIYCFSCFFRKVPVAFHHIFATHQYFSFGRFKVGLKAIVSLNCINFFGFGILYGHFAAFAHTTNGTKYLTVCFVYGYQRRSFGKAIAFAYPHAHIGKKFAYMFGHGTPARNHDFHIATQPCFYFGKYQFFGNLKLQGKQWSRSFAGLFQQPALFAQVKRPVENLQAESAFLGYVFAHAFFNSFQQAWYSKYGCWCGLNNIA